MLSESNYEVSMSDTRGKRVLSSVSCVSDNKIGLSYQAAA